MIYKFIDDNGSEISVNSLSSLQGLVESGTIKKKTLVKVGLRGKYLKAENIQELKFKEKKVEEIPKKTEDIKSVITRESASTTKEEEDKNIEATKVELKSAKTIEEITKDDEIYETPDDQSQNIIQEEEKDIKETEEEKTVPVDETKKKKEFFIKILWRGDYSLGLSFWAFYQLPSFFVSIFAAALEEPALGYNATVGFTLFYTITVWAGIFYIIAAMIGTWKSANKYREEKKIKGKPYGWAIAAQIIIVLGAIGMISGMLTEFLNPS